MNPEFRTVMYRSRSIVPEEQQQIESAVKQIKLVKLIGPLLHPRGDQLKFLLECLPEFSQSFSIPHTRVEVQLSAVAAPEVREFVGLAS